MKRLITCSDGTWNKPNTDDNGTRVHTNVQKIFNFIRHHDEHGNLQIKHYDEGVGAEGSKLTQLLHGATGEGIDNNIKSAYKFIVWNYQEGDELFLLGFSRGAYTARSLAGLIRKCGIIKTNDLDLIDDAYELYRDKKINPHEKAAEDFRKKNSYATEHIKFVGVWDTVGSLGIPLHAFQWINKAKYSFYDTTLSSIIEHAYHALAIDERRGNFTPALWRKSDNKAARVFGEQKFEQRWFTGVHSNVGGGYPDEGLSYLTLRWMIEKAKDAGLAFYEELIQTNLKLNVQGKLYDSLTFPFTLMPKYVREVCKSKDKHGNLDGNETVDSSVWERYQKTGEKFPQNLFGVKQV